MWRRIETVDICWEVKCQISAAAKVTVEWHLTADPLLSHDNLLRLDSTTNIIMRINSWSQFSHQIQMLVCLFVCVRSLNATWWSGTTRCTFPSPCWWRKTLRFGGTAAGSASSTARTARGWSTGGTLWTSDPPLEGASVWLQETSQRRNYFYLFQVEKI